MFSSNKKSDLDVLINDIEEFYDEIASNTKKVFELQTRLAELFGMNLTKLSTYLVEKSKESNEICVVDGVFLKLSADLVSTYVNIKRFTRDIKKYKESLDENRIRQVDISDFYDGESIIDVLDRLAAPLIDIQPEDIDEITGKMNLQEDLTKLANQCVSKQVNVFTRKKEDCK